MPKIFIMDGRSRATLVMSKFLSKRGIEVSVGEERWQCHSFFSKYISRRVIYPSPEKNPSGFVDFMLDYLRREKYDAVFPVRDDTTRLISMHKKELSLLTGVAVPDLDVLKRANDKEQVAVTAIKNGLPCPRTFSSSDENNLSFPLILRPKVGSGSRGIRFIRNSAAWEDLLASESGPSVVFTRYLVQAYIAHECRDQCVCPCLFSMESEPLACFALRKLREYPYGGGPMTYAVSIKNELLIEQTIELLKALKWQGMCSVEYVFDHTDNQHKVTEINARYYGALGTALYAGVDFPFYMYQMAIGQKVVAPKEYRYGVKWRWLFPGDILAFWDHQQKGKEARDFFNFFGSNYAILSLSDPGPTIGNVVDMVYRLVRKKQRDRVFQRGLK